MTALKSSEASIIKEISEMAGEACRVSERCADYWGIQLAKIRALLDGEQTAQVIVSDFWIPGSRLGELKRIVEAHSGLSDLEISDPSGDDKPPTLLRNPGWARPIEALVTMYGTPAYGGFDPTIITTPFFYAFFGICFGDAAYGLLIAGAIAVILSKTRPSESARGFLTIVMIGNLCAFAFGAVTCSWFGDSLTSFSFLKPLGWLSSIQLLDPMRDPMKMLVISLAIGFIQIMLGLAMAMRANLIKGDKVAAFADQGGWILFLCGLVLIGLSAGGVIGIPAKISGMVALAGTVILVATQGREKKSFIGKLLSGVMSLYNVTGYLGDVLSYSRLLALGLGSAAIAMVVNLLSNLVSGVPFIGVLLGILVFVMGHVFGMAINILGAFIHSLRLQYVEFFGKFYDASGEEFKPFTNETCYVRLTK
jgi:V/A-type H+-transporting ATPase subunit I